MRFLTVIILSFLANLHGAQANLYNCDESSGKTVRAPFQEQQELIFIKTEPFIKDSQLNFQNIKNKTPFLIYYVIDSPEAFMQYSVRYELAKLQESCKKSPNVNFAGIINSLYVEKNQIMICKDKKVSYISLKQFSDINEKLIEKRKFISTGDHTDSELGPLTYLTLYGKESNKPFGNYPLAHPDFLHDLIDLVIKEKSLFPTDTYVPFLNLKSHGSNRAVLAGMHDCQAKAKKLSADKIIEKVLSTEEIKFLKSKTTPEKVLEEISLYEKIISKLELGNERGVGSSKIGQQLGGHRLSSSTNGLGQAIIGLGVNEGLGAEFSFGTANINLNWVFNDLFDANPDRSLGFLMLESCDTNRNADFFHSYLNNVIGFYSAKKSLWYRNLNWWDILERSEGSSEKLVEILKVETANIQNIGVVEK